MSHLLIIFDGFVSSQIMKTVCTLFLVLLYLPLIAQREEAAVEGRAVAEKNAVVDEKAILQEKAVLQKKAILQEKAAVQKTIESFFEAFHEQDSIGIKRTVHKDIVMRRIALDSSGAASYKKQEFSEFLTAIVSIPKDVEFEEVISSYTIQIDDPLAQVWTPYSFLVNGKMHHCGTNAFQLFKEDAAWKIIYIIDTGRKEGCE